MANTTTYKLKIQNGDDATEIIVLDHHFHRVAREAGKTIQLDLPQGLYTIKATAGSAFQEKLVSLFNDQTVQFEQVEFTSAIPIKNTRKAHEVHEKNAENNSRLIHKEIGMGSQIYLFSRTLLNSISQVDRIALQHPGTGLSLRDLSNEKLIDFSAPDTGTLGPDEIAPWYACTISLKPGAYILQFQAAAGELYEQILITSPGWQTQVFLLQDNFINAFSTDFNPKLLKGSIQMTPMNNTFSLDYTQDPTYRNSEILKQALSNNRNILSADLLTMLLHKKFINPMIGIYAANILLSNLHKDTNYEYLPEIIYNLRRILVEPHPDVEALAYRSGVGSSYIFHCPPMLRCSWNYILEASIFTPKIVKDHPIFKKMAGHIWTSDHWLVWGSTRQTKEKKLQDIFNTNLIPTKSIRDFVETYGMPASMYNRDRGLQY